MTTETRPRQEPVDAGTDRYLVMSTDGHVGPSVKDQLRPYCDSRYLDDFDRYATEMYSHTYNSAVGFALPQEHLDRVATHAQVAGLKDPDVRLKDMDADGIVADVIFHGGINGESIPFSAFGVATWGSTEYKHLETVGYHIYNRWLVDYCATDRDRLIGVAHIPIWDIDAAVAETKWAKEHGLGAVNLPAQRRDFPGYNDDCWEPLWSVCEELDLPIITHAGGGDFPSYSGPASTALWMLEMPFYARRNLWFLIFGGVFERHPGLKYVMTEQWGDWITEAFRDMESTYYSVQTAYLRESLRSSPREYFERNCFVGASFMAEFEAKMSIEQGYDHKMLWGADYPHAEGTWPRTELAMRKTFSGLPHEKVQAMLGGTATSVFDVNVPRLRELADRIGPRIADIDEPPGELPEFRGSAFRDIGKFS